MSPPIIAAYYYPGWSPCGSRNVRGGNTEWNLLYDDVARSNYPEARRPLSGPVEPAPASLDHEIKQARAGGIDTFLWCWYWDRGQLIFNEPLEMFLQSEAATTFQYALMWVNKRPHLALPFEKLSTAADDESRLVQTDEADFAEMIRHLIEHHWTRPQYLRIDDRPLLPIFTIEPLLRQLGVQRLTELLAMGNDLARSAGFGGVEYVAIMHRAATHHRQWLTRLGLQHQPASPPLLDIGFRAVSTYLFLPDWEGEARQGYQPLIEKRVAEWPGLVEQFGLPLWPSVAPGWDARTRGAPLDPPPAGHPWTPVVSGETPAAFARLLEHWRAFAATRGGIPILPVCSWNEWSEGHAVAPCDRHGDGMLEALRQFKASFATS